MCGLAYTTRQHKDLRGANEVAQTVRSLRYTKCFGLCPTHPHSSHSSTHPPSTLHQYPAARLFIERARAAEASFEVTARNARAIAQVCRRLDGIPLAIELAAARVRAMSVETIAARLHERFGLDHTTIQPERPPVIQLRPERPREPGDESS